MKVSTARTTARTTAGSTSGPPGGRMHPERDTARRAQNDKDNFFHNSS